MDFAAAKASLVVSIIIIIIISSSSSSGGGGGSDSTSSCSDSSKILPVYKYKLGARAGGREIQRPKLECPASFKPILGQIPPPIPLTTAQLQFPHSLTDLEKSHQLTPATRPPSN